MNKSEESSGAGAKVDGGLKAIDWAKYTPKAVGKEDALSSPEVKKRWEKLYKDLGKASAGEDEKRSIRCAVYAYALVNGTSRAGNYSRTVTTSGGFEFAAAKIISAVGITTMRQFLRGEMEESYNFLKHSGYVQDKESRFLAKAANLGVGPDEAFAMGDWFADCPWFTPLEKKAHEISGNRGLTRANLARGGNSLEDVEADSVEASVKAGTHVPEVVGKGQW